MQGEILLGVQEFRPSSYDSLSMSGEGITFLPVVHPRALVITPDCDLLSDYSARETPPNNERQRLGRLLEHIQLCDVFVEEEIRSDRDLNSNLWSRVRGNQDERYHAFHSVGEENSEDLTYPAYFLDFKRMFTMPTEFMYALLNCGHTQRMGTVPPVWIHQLIQRYFAFHSRVGVPDPTDAYRQAQDIR